VTGECPKAFGPASVFGIDVFDHGTHHHNEKEHRQTEPERAIDQKLVQPFRARDLGVNMPAMKKNTAMPNMATMMNRLGMLITGSPTRGSLNTQLPMPVHAMSAPRSEATERQLML
jgi:hypothetical protein